MEASNSERVSGAEIEDNEESIVVDLFDASEAVGEMYRGRRKRSPEARHHDDNSSGGLQGSRLAQDSFG